MIISKYKIYLKKQQLVNIQFPYTCTALLGFFHHWTFFFPVDYDISGEALNATPTSSDLILSTAPVLTSLRPDEIRNLKA